MTGLLGDGENLVREDQVGIVNRRGVAAHDIDIFDPLSIGTVGDTPQGIAALHNHQLAAVEPSDRSRVATGSS